VSLDILVLAELEKVSNLRESHTVRHYLAREYGDMIPIPLRSVRA
jgi:hypothetical protein